MRKFYRCRRFLSAMLLACAMPVLYAGVPALAEESGQVESAEATVMQLMKTEGTVDISNGSGKNISLISNMKLYNGYHAETQEASYAWINLDSEKLTKLDAVSEAEIRKSGKKLELLLESGSLFFNVKEDLQEDETLNVRTSTMVMGIRGTSGWVRTVDRWHTQVYILEGTVQCHVTDPVTGQVKSVTLNSGESADFYAYPQEQEGDKCDIVTQKFTEDDIDGYVLVELVQDIPLCEEIKEASGLDILGLADTAQPRLEEREAEMRQILAEIREKEAGQEHRISKDPVWKDEDSTAGIPGSGTGNNQWPLYPGQGIDTGTGTGSSTGSGSEEGPVFIPVVSDQDASSSSAGSGSGSGSDSSSLSKPNPNFVNIQNFIGTYVNGDDTAAGKITVSERDGQSVTVRLEAYRTADDEERSVVFEGIGWLIGNRLTVQISGQMVSFMKGTGGYVLLVPEMLKQTWNLPSGVYDNQYYPEEQKPEEPYDPYAKVLAEYREACTLNYSDFIADPAGSLSGYTYVSQKVMQEYFLGNTAEIYYMYLDINGDGQDEMLVGMESETAVWAMAVYTYDKEADQVIGNWVRNGGFPYYQRYRIMTDGTIINAMADNVYALNIREDNRVLSQVDSYNYFAQPPSFTAGRFYISSKENGYIAEKGWTEIEYNWTALNVAQTERYVNPLTVMSAEDKDKVEAILTEAYDQAAEVYFEDGDGVYHGRNKWSDDSANLRLLIDESTVKLDPDGKIVLLVPFLVDLTITSKLDGGSTVTDDGNTTSWGGIGVALYPNVTGYFLLKEIGDMNQGFDVYQTNLSQDRQYEPGGLNQNQDRYLLGHYTL